MTKFIGTTLIAALLVAGAPAPYSMTYGTASGADPERTYDGFADDKADEAVVTGNASGWTETEEGRNPTNQGPRDKYIRTDAVTCNMAPDLEWLRDVAITPGACPEGAMPIDIIVPCEDDEYELAALWVQRVQDDGTYADPEQLTEDQCVTPADLTAEARKAFARMKITAPPATIQGGEPMLVNVHYPAYTTAAPQDLETVLLDVPVVIRAEPIEFAWDFDDPYSPGGDTLVTADPGRPWHDGDAAPDNTWIGHTYSRLGTPGSDAGTAVDPEGDAYRSGVTVGLTTTWQGSFRIQGTSVWTPIDGTITTAGTTQPATITEARTRLVCDDLDGNDTC